MDCEHNWTEKTFPGLETRWCTRCNDTETEVELATLRAEVERLKATLRLLWGYATDTWMPRNCREAVEAALKEGE